MLQRWLVGTLLVLWSCLTLAGPAAQPEAPTPHGTLLVPDAARAGPAFNPDLATQAYLDTVSGAARARSDAYFEGGYWVEWWDLLYGLAVAALLILSGASAWLRTRIERLTHRHWLQSLLYGGGYLAATALLALPWSLYRDFFREHRYGLSNLTLGGWLGEWLTLNAVTLVLGALLIALVYAALVRTRRWWLPVAIVTTGFLYFVELIVPVYVSPLFNHYQRLPDGPVRSAVLSMARANGVPASDVYWFDASRQTTRPSANVSGLGATTRISLNDNLLRDASLPEIKAVMGHELGHYVLNHTVTTPIEFGLVIALAAALTQWLARGVLRRLGGRGALRDERDLAALPVLLGVASVALYVATPLLNTITRTHELEADRFGLNAAREPHGFANAALRLSSYRKLDPGPVEEFVFFDHPSGRTRIRAAMVWFAEHPTDGAGAGPAPAP